MTVLWICNLILPRIASTLGLDSIPKEGWVEGLLRELIYEKNKSGEGIIPQIAFPLDKKSFKKIGGDPKVGYLSGSSDDGKVMLKFYAFLENVVKEDEYDVRLEDRLKAIFDESCPDVVHCFGAEYPHTLAAANAIDDPGKLLIGLQGICREIAYNYTANLPADIVTRHTFRDFIKKDSVYERQNKFFKRAESEKKAVEITGNVLGRTAFDNEYALEVNPSVNYFQVGENLRNEFYTGAWSERTAVKHRIFLSQADYPLKGFHYLIRAVGELIRESAEAGSDEFSDISIYIAGQSLVRYRSIFDKLKISSYGLYLRELMDEYGLEGRVHHLGRLDANGMKEQYLLCDTFVCCSSCENSSNSLGEAMMLQTPVVTALVGGLSSVFKEGEDGFSYHVTADDDFESISEKLKETLKERWRKDRETFSKMDRYRHNAGFHARENHNPAKNVHDLLKAYKRICR